jgi:hypothetical protein
MSVEPITAIKLASSTAITATGLIATGIPDPQSFDGWGIHLVLGAVAIACLWVVYKMSERQLESVEKQAESLLKMTTAIDKQTEGINALSVELKRSPCLLHRMQERREDLSPEVAGLFDHERKSR